MTKNHMKAFCVMLMAIVLGGASCKKIEEIHPEGLPDNRILEYLITNVSGDPIKGVINHNEKSIKVYLPYYLGLTAIETKVKVSEGAQITSLNDEIITDVVGLVKGRNEVSYTVLGKGNTEATYKLTIEVQQPDFEMLELSASAESLKSYTIMFEGMPLLQIYWKNRKPPISNYDVTKIVLIDQKGAEFIFADKNVAFSTNRITVSTPANYTELSTGTYKVRIDSYSKSYELKYPIQITLP